MVIGIFNDTFPPFMDGVGRVTYNYALCLSKLGHTVYVVTGDYYNATKTNFDKQQNYPFTVFRLKVINYPGTKPYGILCSSKKIMNALREIKFDIIHIQSPFYTGSIGRKIAKEQNVPLVGSFHTLYFEDIKAATKLKVIQNIVMKKIMREYEKCDIVWTPSEETKIKLQNQPYSFKKNIEVMPNGCDITVPTSQKLEEFSRKAEELIGHTDAPILLYIGQHSDKKNIPLMLDALKIASEQNVNYKMIFVGTGPDEEKYKKVVGENALSEKIKFLGVIKDREIISALLSKAYLFLFPSYYDTSCLVKREAACFNVPTLFGKGAATAEDISDKVNGYLTENNASDMAKVITYAITHKDERDKIGEEAHKTLYVSWQTVVENVASEYEKLMHSSKECKGTK